MNSFCNYFYPYYGKARGYLHYYLPNYGEFDLNEVHPDLYVGGVGSAFNKEKMQEIGITHVIVAVKGMDIPFPDDFKYMKIEAIDNETEDLSNEFEKTSIFIDDAITKGGKCLVHCICGVSRSVSIACAYLLYKKKAETVEDVIALIQKKRKIANPNPGFQSQLLQFISSRDCNKNIL